MGTWGSGFDLRYPSGRVPTTAVAKSCQQLFDYVATHPNAGIRYKACDMILAVHTIASYLLEQNGKSRASAHFYLTNHDDEEFNSGAILRLSSIIKHVMSSASEAELAALYYGCKLAIPICTTLKEMGYPQLKCTMITTGNITAQGLTMGTMTPKASKLMDQCLHWLKCRNAQCQFLYLWHCGIDNWANYASKHHPEKHHTKQSIHSTSRTLYHNNELFSSVHSNLFPMFSHKLIPRSFPVKLLSNKPSMHLQGCVIISIIQPGYSCYDPYYPTRILRLFKHSLTYY